MVFGAVELISSLVTRSQTGPGGDALDHKADALRHGKAGIAQHGVHQVIGTRHRMLATLSVMDVTPLTRPM